MRVTRKRQEHLGKRLCPILACLLLLILVGCVNASPPSVGTVTTNDTGRGIGRYEKFEITFPVRTVAANLQLPYDPVGPPYSANLEPDEDARQGVSVDALFLPPGQTDWNQARVQPGFLYRAYVRTPPAAPHHTIENLVGTGQDVWKVRWAPTMTGRWLFRVRVADAGGTALTRPQSLTCVPSTSPGFLRVSPTDSRYFQWDSGAPANMAGDNLFFSGLDQFKGSVDRISATGASALLRVWIAGRSGQEIIGGFANSTGGRWWFLGDGAQLWRAEAHGGRFCLSVPGGSEATTREVPLEPNKDYAVTAWVKSKGASSLTVTTQDSDTYAHSQDTTLPLAGDEWTRLRVPMTARDPQHGANFFGTVKFRPQGGTLLLDDVQVVDEATHTDVLEVGDFERHVHYNQRQSWLLDEIVEYAARHGQYLRLTCLENDDSVFCDIGSDGGAAPHDANNFFGVSGDPSADLPVRQFQRYYARYLIARWGYSTAVAQWEFNNEGALFNGNHYAAAQSFAHAVHEYGAEGHRPCSTSFWMNSAGTSYPTDFYDSPAYPDIDYADVHDSPQPGMPGGYAPFGAPNGGWVRRPSGGPNGLGVIHLDGDVTAGQEQHTQFCLSRIRGRGRWTISYWSRADNGARLNWFGHGPDLGFYAKDLLPGPFAVPNNPTAPTLPPGHSWCRYSASFPVPDDKTHSVSLWAYAVGLRGGSIDFSDVTVTAPDGRTWAQYAFSEPLMDHDSAALGQYVGLQYTSQSGDPSIGKPLSIGELDFIRPDGGYNTDIGQDEAGVYLRQFCWAQLNPSGATTFLYTNAGGLATERGYWKYLAAYQRFLRGVPLTNGRYRDIAAASDPRLIVIGQKDEKAGRAHFFVYNRDGAWFNLATTPAAVKPVTGTVTVSGLPAGRYAVEIWNTSIGRVQTTLICKATVQGVTVPINTLAADEAVKITPVTVP